MHLLLIRHGETEHNVAGLLAGVTDSNLTNHGIIQAQRLGKYLTLERGLRFTHFFASDLQRAWMTAGEVQKAQSLQIPNDLPLPEVVRLKQLREQDFGSLELVPWSANLDDGSVAVPGPNDPNYKPKERAEAMKARADLFLDDFISPLLALEEEDSEYRVAVVSHGLLLACLWRCLLARFGPKTVVLSPEAAAMHAGRPLEHVGGWTNTGYLEVTIRKTNPDRQASRTASDAKHVTKDDVHMFSGLILTVNAINAKDHLLNLKRTRGGVGSATYDAKQQNIHGFFKPSKTEKEND